MDKYLELINEKKKEIDTLKNEIEKITEDAELSKSTAKRLENEIAELTREINELDEIKHLPTALKGIKISKFISAIFAFAIGIFIIAIINLIKGDSFFISLENIISIVFGVCIANPVIYLFDTKDIRKKLRGNDPNNIDSKITEKPQRKESLKKEYDLTIDQRIKLHDELKEKRAIVDTINQKIKRIEELRANVIDIMLEDYLAHQINEFAIPDELQKSDLYDPKVKQKLPSKDN